MAKATRTGAALDGFGPPPETRTWAQAPGTYIAGRAHLDEVDLTAAAMESKWGADRLRLLVPPDLREKFDRQRYKLNQAIWHGDLEAVRRESARMLAAWRALDRAAAASNARELDPAVWEFTLANGSVVALVRDGVDARLVTAQGRAVSVYTLDEIARLIEAVPAVMAAKEQWPGATVTTSRRTIEDPLLSIHDTREPLDEEQGDDISF